MSASELEDVLVLLESCDGWQILKDTTEPSGKKYLAKVWKTLPGAALPAGRHSYGATIREAVTGALAKWDQLLAEVTNNVKSA